LCVAGHVGGCGGCAAVWTPLEGHGMRWDGVDRCGGRVRRARVSMRLGRVRVVVRV